MRAIEHANFSIKVGKAGFDVRINGRAKIIKYPCAETTSYHGVLTAEYTAKNDRSSAISVRWDSLKDEPSMSHMSGGGDAEESLVISEMFAHTAVMMKQWKLEGWKTTYNNLFQLAPWEPEDAGCYKHFYTEVDYDSWRERRKEAAQETRERKIEEFALTFDPHNEIRPIVRALLDRVQTNKHLQLKKTKHYRKALHRMLEQGELDQVMKRAVKHEGLDGLHLQILDDCLFILISDRSKIGTEIRKAIETHRKLLLARINSDETDTE